MKVFQINQCGFMDKLWYFT